jgi:hypothetical protein
MKKIYILFSLCFLFAFSNAQYCSTGSVKDNKNLSLPKITVANFSHTFAYDTLTYYDFTGIDTIDLSTNVLNKITIDWESKVGNALVLIAYIDFNSDSIFSNSTERILIKSINYRLVNNFGTLSSTFSIPANVVSGKFARLRIIFSNGFSYDPCDSNSDYSTSRDYLVRFKKCDSFFGFSPPSDTTLCDSTIAYNLPFTDSSFHYLWSNGDTSKSTTINSSGFYSLEVKNDSGCYSKTEFNVFNKDSIFADFSWQPSWSPGTNKFTIFVTNQSLGATKFYWYLDEILISTDRDFSYSQQSGKQNLKLVAYNDCDSFEIVTKLVGGVRESITESESLKFSLSPNPTSTILFLQAENDLLEESVQIRILDALGKEEKLLRTNLSNGKMSIDVSQLSNGLHFLELQTSKGNSIQKFVKE